MIEFNVYKPTAVGDLFNVAPDKSPWESTEKYVRKGSIWVPNRIKTLNSNEILNPKNQKVDSFFAKGSASNHGIYVMFFAKQKIFYVGIAAQYSYKKKWTNQKTKISGGDFETFEKASA